jgi:type IV secretion system protein VirD4
MPASRRRPSSRPARGGGLPAGDLAIGAAVVAIVAAETGRRLATALERHALAAWLAGGFAVLLLGAAVPAWKHSHRVGPSESPSRTRRSSGRRVSGLDADQRPAEGWASRRDLAPLLTRDVTGDRVVLGRWRRDLVAAERLQSVLVVGPSQSGKTTSLAIPALCDWHGPVLATSVKTDLFHSTVDSRRSRGPVAVFDPTGITGMRSSSWSPLSGAASWAGARKVAESLCSTGRREGGIEDAGYWYAAAERLLAPLLRAASLVNGSMGDVVRWLDEEAASDPLLALELADEHDAARQARSCLTMEGRQRSSVYSTAQTVLAAYGDPAVLQSERQGAPFDPSWLLERGAMPPTLYCCAPARDQARLGPVFVALVRQVLDAAFESASRQGAPLDPPLLVVLDEAANIAPLADLDQVLATAAGHGICLVTVWQDLAQIEARYGDRWATIVNNHRAKAVFPGLADPRTLELLSSLIGDVEAAQRSSSRSADGSWSETEGSWRVPVAPAGWIRRLPAGNVLVVYGGLPPALVTMRRAGCSQ